MNKSQCYIASTLCIVFALVYSYPPLVAVVYSSILIALGGIFFLIGINK